VVQGGPVRGSRGGSRRPGGQLTLLRPRVVPRPVLDLLGQARIGLAEAARLAPAGERYAGAHLAALRGTAAVLASRTSAERPAGRRRRLRSAWELLCEVAPEMGEWAAYFAAGAAKRAAAEAGVAHAVTAREADDLVRDVEMFLAVVATTVGIGQSARPAAHPASRAAAAPPSSRPAGHPAFPTAVRPEQH